MTVITIVLIAVVLGIGTIIVNSLMNSSKKSSCCQSNGGIWRDGSCFATCTSTTGKTGCTGSISTTCSS